MNRSGDSRPVELATILHAAYSAQAEVEAKLSEVGLSMAKLVALKALSDAGEAVQLSQLAERLACVKSNVTQLVDRLEADGLVVRQPDPHDRRTKLAALTPSGRRACQEGVRVQEDAERQLLKALTQDEAEQLVALLAKVGRD